MEIKDINSKIVWQDFFDKTGSSSFLQTWEWGEFQKKLDYEIIRLGIYKSEELLGIALVIKIASGRGNFLFVPHGPILKNQITNFKCQNLLEILINYLKKTAKAENYSFIRISPLLEDNPQNIKIFKDLGFRKSSIYMHAERVWILSIEKSEEQLLAEMRKTTRYSIKKAIRDGVIIEKRVDKKAIEDFYKIYKETAKRESFVPFSKHYIEQEFKVFCQTGNATFLFGNLTKANSTIKVENDYLASSLIVFTKSTAFYHQGASFHTKIPVTYLLQWEAIKEAKKRGCKLYNFWGTLREGRTPKSWAGLSLFKQGFGGGERDYLATQDFIISPKYYLTYFYEKYLGWKRGV